ncbi:MAG: SusC/RagA family TonB-linked outer membrane protein [Chryseolinea sp.]
MKKALLKKRPLMVLALCLCMLSMAHGQNATVSGKVTAASDGSPLPGVNVIVKGSSTGTTTDSDGLFTVNAGGSDAVLVFSFIGFTSQELPVGTQTTINVTLAEDATQLGEVVVTALGIEKKDEQIGYSVSKVSGDLMSKARETNVALSLAGRVAGLSVSGTNGGPGSSARIMLRGLSSFGASTPLFVINGVPIDNTQRGAAGEWGGADQGDGISNINPDDIADMTVLKGAAASALYGSRAANGVIIITTKKGKRGDLSIEYNGTYQMEKAINYTDFQYDYGQGQHGAKPTTAAGALASGAYSWGAKLDGSPTIQFDGKNYPYSAVKDNIATFYRTAPTWTNTVSVSKGGEQGSFRLSMSNMDNKAILRNSGLTRRTVNLNIEQNLTKKIKIGVVANYIDDANKNKPQLSDGPMNANNINTLATNIDNSVLNPGYDVNNNGAEQTWRDDIYVTNPWFVVNQYKNNVDRKRLISIVTARYDITKWLFLQGRLGYDISNDRTFKVEPWGTAYTNLKSGNLQELSRAQRSEMNTDVLLGFSKAITSDFSVDIAAGANLRKNNFEQLGLNGNQFVIPYFYSYNNVTTFNRTYDYKKREVHSAYYTADFTYKSILTLSTTGRYDVYSTLPANNNSIFTSSVTGSFIFGDLIHVPEISYGKFRASYGQVSGEPDEPYQTSQYYSVGSTLNGTSTGSFNASLPNLFLKPFTLGEFEVGTEIKFFNNRLGLDVTYFDRKTKNEIINGALSRATGRESGYIATGSTSNKGVELLLTGSPIKNGAFSWDVSFNFTALKNKIEDIYGDGSTNTTLTLGTYRPLNANTAYVKGLSGPQVMAYDYSRNPNGQIIVDDAGIPVRGALVPMGSVLPKTYGGINNTFTYKGIALAFLIDGKFGNKVLSATNHYSIYNGLNTMTLEGREGGVTFDGVHADGSVNEVKTDAQDFYRGYVNNVSKLNVLDASFIKLRQVTLGYTIPKSVFGAFPVQSVSISFVARNLATLMSKLDNIDPEAGFSSVVKYAGIEGNSLPSTRSYGFNLNVKF